MRKSLKSYASFSIFRYLANIPSIIMKIRNWAPFLINHMGISNTGELYIFRNGLTLETKEGIDATTISVVFIRKEYGLVKDNSTIVDIGANIGAYSIFAASTARNTTIYSYEPVISNYCCLQNNIRRNRMEDRITPFNKAVGARSGSMRLFYHGDQSLSGFYSNWPAKNTEEYIDVECVSILDIFETNNIQKCDMMKIDCEGSEFEIIYNIPEEYFKIIKEIRLEYHNRTTNDAFNIGSLINFMTDRKYEIIRHVKESKSLGIVWFKSKSQEIC